MSDREQWTSPKLTADDPIHPEKVEKLETIEDVFGHFKPNIDVTFEDEEGQEVDENFRFKTVADFLIKNMTKNSPFLNGLDNQKAFYNKMLKQLRSNKIMQRALQNADAREAFVEVLQLLLAEMEANDKKHGRRIITTGSCDRRRSSASTAKSKRDERSNL